MEKLSIKDLPKEIEQVYISANTIAKLWGHSLYLSLLCLSTSSISGNNYLSLSSLGVGRGYSFACFSMRELFVDIYNLSLST